MEAQQKMTETPKRAQRAGHGADTIYWDPVKKSYVGAVSLGYAPNGKRRRPKVYGKTKTEVRNKIRDLKKEMQTGVKAPANYTVADAVNDWLERGLKGRDEKGTIGKNRSMANKHLIPFIGKAKLKDLSADDVDDWLDDRAEFLATRSLRDLLAILRRSVAHAQRRDKAARNVALLVTAPEGRPGRPSKALNLEQAKAVLIAARPSRLYAYLVLSLLSGVRTEEARPLTWDHVFLEPVRPRPGRAAGPSLCRSRWSTSSKSTCDGRSRSGHRGGWSGARLAASSRPGAANHSTRPTSGETSRPS
jgi:hypothetical protein